MPYPSPDFQPPDNPTVLEWLIYLGSASALAYGFFNGLSRLFHLAF